MSSFEIISDYSKTNLTEIPDNILKMANLKMLFLEKNFLVTLPEDFFYRLPNLMWLDLRNNQLKEIPKCIAHHEHLEHLLLTNNKIGRLPNELGLVSNLKALQIADNPLVYPSKKIIQEGTKAIKKFLKEQYEIHSVENMAQKKQTIAEDEEFRKELSNHQNEEEKIIRVHEKASYDQSEASKHTFYSGHKINNIKSEEYASPKLTNKNIQQLQNRLSDPHGLSPTLRVRKIEQLNKKPEEPLKIIHNVSKSSSKISLKSCFNQSGTKGKLSRIPENIVKDGWLNKLRILLNDQERILQQERNLRALSQWRQKRPFTPKIFYDTENSDRIPEAPYATYPEYSKIPNREELANQLQAFLKGSHDINARTTKASKVNLDKVINDLVEQLKEMEITCNESRSPRGEMDSAGKQIQMIVDIHKKLLQLRASNDFI